MPYFVNRFIIELHPVEIPELLLVGLAGLPPSATIISMSPPPERILEIQPAMLPASFRVGMIIEKVIPNLPPLSLC